MRKIVRHVARLPRSWLLACLLAFAPPLAAAAQEGSIAWSHALSVHGAPALPAGFDHFPYVDPDAPRVCTLREASLGRFDNLNPFISDGSLAMGTFFYLYDALMEASEDEIEVAYGLVAEAVAWDPASRALRFRIDPRARFQDGVPVTAEDVVFTAETLAAHGRAYYRAVLWGVEAEAESDRVVLFRLPADGAVRPFDIATLPVLPRHWWQGRAFDEPTLDPPLGGGAFRVAQVDPGRRIVFERVPDYWAQDHPTQRGRYNFARIETSYVMDQAVLFEMFLRHETDRFVDFDAIHWATAYDLPAVENGEIVRAELPNWFPVGMNGFFFNLNQERFRDRRVREALSLAVDWDWVNDALYYGGYRRTSSYFENTDLAASGPPDAAQRALLAPLAGILPPEAFEAPWRPLTGDGSGRDRRALARAASLLAEAGWTFADGVLHDPSGVPVELRIISAMPRQDRFLGHVIANWQRLGIAATFAKLEGPDYIARIDAGSFDLAYRFIIPGLWPGAELADAWGTAAIRTGGEPNPFGLGDPAIDRLIETVEAAGDRAALRTAAGALDRALQWQLYAIPSYFDPVRRVATWDRFDRPARAPQYGWGEDSWWCRE